jgi:hypothetical protein
VDSNNQDESVACTRRFCRSHHSSSSIKRGSHHLKDNEAMSGIQFVTDEKGRKVAVQIDLKKHRQLWEDLRDLLVSRSRRHEKRIPLRRVKSRLIKSGKLSYTSP